MQVRHLLPIAAFALTTAAFAADNNFDRTLTTSGSPEVSVSTGSGYVHLRAGSDSQVHVSAHLHGNNGSSWFGGSGGDVQSRIEQIVANPPIQQSGDSIQIGERHGGDKYRNISIDYEITLPRGAKIDASTGSGDIETQDVGSSLKADSGSGSVRAHSVHGAATLQTGSGDIELDENAKYSWIKAPRWRGHAMEVGPLARYVVGYASGHKEITEQINATLAALNVPIDALFSTLGRTAARALEAQRCCHLQRHFMDKLIARIKAGDSSTANVERWDPETWPKEAKGVGFSEAPRGALAHWIRIKDTKIDNYQCVVPTTWNGSPRDNEGNIGAFEASLMNTKVERHEEPVEILRTIHSFDPCLACSTHVMSEDGRELANVKVR